MNEVRKAWEAMLQYKREFNQNNKGSDTGSNDLCAALEVALPIVKAAIKCDRCGRKAEELSETGKSYCKRCWKAVTDGRTPY